MGRQGPPGRQDPLGTRASYRVTSWWATGDPGSTWQLSNCSPGQAAKGALTWLPLPGEGRGDSGWGFVSLGTAGVLPGVCAWGTVAAPGHAVPCCAVLCRAIALLLGVATQALLSCGKASQQNSRLTPFFPQLPLKVESAQLSPAGDRDAALGLGPPCPAQDGGLSTNHPGRGRAGPGQAEPSRAGLRQRRGRVRRHWAEAVAAAPAMRLPGLSSPTVAPGKHFEGGSTRGCRTERGPGRAGTGW